jgi:hypothetical protein
MADSAASAPHVTLATYERLPGLTAEDRAVAAALGRRGVRVRAAVWSDRAAWAGDPGLVVVRSCWDYHLRLAEFEGWLAGLRARGVAVRNPSGVLRWNARKRYLLDLAARGVSTLPTVLLPVGGSDALGAALALAADDPARWRDVVVKPAVSASAFLTVRVRVGTHADEGVADALRGFDALPAGSEVLVQPFAPSVAEIGETSLVYLGGRFSHAVTKRPAAGDFRVQEELGGSSRAADAPAALVAWGEGVLDAAGALCDVPVAEITYARVDVLAEAAPRLMELELVEPSLFLRHAPDAAERFADAIVAALG